MNRKTPKCSKGFPCGKTCISRSRLCWANLSSNNNKIAESFSQFVNRLVGIGNDQESIIDPNAGNNPESTNIGPSLNDEVPVPVGRRKPSEEGIQKLKEIFKKDEYFAEKLAKTRKEYPQLSEEEAMGVSFWISQKYKDMNYLLYTENLSEKELEEKSEVVAANYYAHQAIVNGKLPKYSKDKMLDLMDERGSQATIDDSGILLRGISLDTENILQIANYYNDNNGKEIKEETFFPTTAYEAKDLGFTRNANIIYQVVPKENTNGVMVDHAKNINVEGEVLFAPGQKFKVVSVELPKFKGGYTFEEGQKILKRKEQLFNKLEKEHLKKLNEIKELIDIDEINQLESSSNDLIDFISNLAGTSSDNLTLEEFEWRIPYTIKNSLSDEELENLYNYSKSIDINLEELNEYNNIKDVSLDNKSKLIIKLQEI